MTLAVVTATLDQDRSAACLDSWVRHAAGAPALYVVVQAPCVTVGWRGQSRTYWTPEILGVVPAFAIGVQYALEEGAEIIACLHDDLLIEETGWDQQVRDLFNLLPEMGLCGFGGALGLGDSDIYQTPYNPMQLARQTFLSNMRHAEAHGGRTQRFRLVSCLDGFSQIGRRELWEGKAAPSLPDVILCPTCGAKGFRPSAQFGPRGRLCSFCDGGENGDWENLFEIMQDWKITHHAYDAALGCFAKRLGWRVGLVPIACHHFGGQTAVADTRYTNWAREQFSSITHDGQQVQGDAACWTHAHREVYERFRDVLPLRVP